MRNNNLIGTGVALITPFNNDYTIDFKSLDNLIDNLINNNINYVVVMGTTAESATLSKAEKINILKHVKKKINGRIPIVFGIGGNNTTDVISLIKEIDLKGVEAILSVAPYYNKPTQDGLYAHFEQIALNSPVDIILYNVPSRTSVNINVETIKKLAENHKNIIGIKEASGDIVKSMDIISKTPKDFMLISGDDKLTFPIMSLGGCGVISVQAMAFPNLFVKMVNYLLQYDLESAKKIHFKLLESVDLFYIDGNPAGIKTALSFLKICSSSQLRLPLVKMSHDNANKLCQLIKNSID